ncbi:MAG: T9SS type A sorting domain-containing protein [Bacteroidales bacterium]|nr:T9SS type A sorting domain-containing protein [Bacteroidales bacterium]
MKYRLFLFTFLLFAVSQANSTIHYVYPGGRGLCDGTSWNNAAPDIQFLLTPSNFPIALGNTVNPNYPNNDDTIFVAGGTYDKVWMHCVGCTYGNDSLQGCAVCRLHFYGGFNGNETSLDQRPNWLNNPSIIDAQGDRAVWFEDSIPCAGNVVFDGFIVTGAGRRKEAFRIVNTNAWISHVIVKDNIGLPFFIEHLPFYPNHDIYSTATLTDVAVYNNKGKGWPASAVVSATSQFKMFNTTFTNNSCDSIWNGHPLSLFYFYAGKSVFYIYNSILWKNDFGDIIVDATINNPPTIYHKTSIIQQCFDNTSDWTVYGNHLGSSADTSPQFTADYHLALSSPAIGMANITDYPFYQTVTLYYLRHLFAFYFHDVNGKMRFGWDNQQGMPTLDAGAEQINRIDEEDFQDIEYWINDKWLPGGNITLSQQQQISQKENQESPMIFPTQLTPLQPINICGIDGHYLVSVFDAQGHLVINQQCQYNDMIFSPTNQGIYLLVITKDGKPTNKEIIIVK